MGGALRARRADGDLECGEGAAGVAIAEAGPDGEGVVGDGEGEFAEAAVGVGDGAAEERDDVGLAQRLELEEGAAADQRAVDGEKRVFGGGADEGDDAALDIAEQHVLLAAAEAVDLVEKEDGALTVVCQAALGGLGDLADAGDADTGGVLALEVTLERAGDDLGEGGFADAGRAVEQDAGERASIEHAAEEFARAEDVLLSGELVERARAHAHGQRLGGADGIEAALGEEVGHGGGYAGAGSRPRALGRKQSECHWEPSQYD